MIRTYPICTAHPHHHGESLKSIVTRIERDLSAQPRPARRVAIPAPNRLARRTF
jgi:hypothetical protein